MNSTSQNVDPSAPEPHPTRTAPRHQARAVNGAAGSSVLDEDARAAVKAAHLRYVTDRTPGITRERHGDAFRYLDPAGKPIKDPEELRRIKATGVPPAWTHVWICPDPNGHLQATGRDARGRKQYRYHTRWRSIRDETKYERMMVFGSCLPKIRRRVEADLARPGLPCEKVLAAVVRLMERTLARVGNPEYARENESFGLTTLRNRHVHVTRGRLELDFRAKSGVRHRSIVTDAKLARIVKRCRELPGSELFQYIDEEGNRHSIDSGDVNEYLRTISGCEITAKDFRTWAASNLALLAISELDEERPSKHGSVEIIKKVAQQLGNTPAVCRKSYIHPALIESYLSGTLRPCPNGSNGGGPDSVWAVERKLIDFLKTQASAPAKSLRSSLKASIRDARKNATKNRGAPPIANERVATRPD
jgi:DNA topoisomerase I